MQTTLAALLLLAVPALAEAPSKSLQFEGAELTGQVEVKDQKPLLDELMRRFREENDAMLLRHASLRQDFDQRGREIKDPVERLRQRQALDRKLRKEAEARYASQNRELCDKLGGAHCRNRVIKAKSSARVKDRLAKPAAR
jgi:hypothetical protein